MDSKELLHSIAEDFFNDETEHIVYFSLSASSMEDCREMFSSDTFIIDIAGCESPLAPFLDIVKSNNLTESQITQNVYKMHQNIFLSYLLNDAFEERKEPVVLEEMDFEKIQIRQSILNLIEQFSDKKVVVLNCQLMGEDSFKILRELKQRNLKGKFVFCFNNMDIDNYSSFFKDFISLVHGCPNFYSINSFEPISAGRNFVSYSEDNSYENLLNRLRSLRLYMDFSQACKLVKKIDSHNLLEDFTVAESRLLNYEMGLVSYYGGDLDFATFCFSNVTEALVDDELDCYANFMLACLANGKNMTTSALKYANKGLLKAKKFENSPVFTLLTMIDYIITERTDSEFSTEKYFNAISLLDKIGYVNNKIYTSLIIPYGVIYDDKLRKRMRVQIEKSMKEADEIGNKFGLSTACHWMGIIMTYEGRKNNSLEWYQRCFSLRKEIGDVASITKITNGLAFEYMVDTKYKISYNLINDCVSNLLYSRDYPEIVITLYNFGRACFFSKNINLAYRIFQCIYNLLNIFDISDLLGNPFLPEYNDVLIYVAMIDFYRGELNRAKMNIYNVSNNGKKIQQVEAYFINFLSDCIDLKDGKIEEACEDFDEIVESFISKKFNVDYILVFMLYEFAEILKQVKQPELSKDYLLRGFKIAKDRNLVYYTQEKDSITIEDYENAFEELEPLKVDLLLFEEKAEKEKLVNQLHRRLRDSKFLNKLVTSHISSSADSGFMNNAVQAIFDYMIADGVFLAEKNEDNEWKISASVVREEMINPPVGLWKKISEDEHTVSVETLQDGRIAVYINLSKFEFVSGIIIYLQHNMQISSEEKSILNVAASNIQAQLVMLKQNEYLALISSTDQLSKLNNRRALRDHLSIESELIRRYQQKRNLKMKETIAFIDLDNFKYYNDTFGHETGDLLISEFARLLKKIYRKVDFIARFGGDEFVIMLPNTSCDEAVQAAERLFEGLKKENHFIEKIEELLENKISVPEDKYLNFSMGICSNEDVEELSNLELVMSQADKALYQSKQHGKGTVTIWKDLSDSSEK